METETGMGIATQKLVGMGIDDCAKSSRTTQQFGWWSEVAVRVGPDQQSYPTPGPVSIGMADHVRVQFPVRDIYLGM